MVTEKCLPAISEDLPRFPEEIHWGKSPLQEGSQSAWAPALAFDLLDGPDRQAAVADLDEDVIRHVFQLTTGFAGTPALLVALSYAGYADTAWQLLLQEDCPG